MSDSPKTKTLAIWRALVTALGQDTISHAGSIAVKATIFTVVAELSSFRSSMVAINIGCTLLLLAWAPLLNRRWRSPALFLINLWVSLILFVDIGYQRYFGDFLSAAVVFSQIDQIDNVQSSASNLVRPADLLWFLDLAIMALMGLVRRARRTPALTEPTRSRSLRLRAMTAMVLLAVLLVSIPIAQRVSRHGGRLYGSMWSHRHFTDVNGVLFFHTYDVATYLRDQVFTPQPDEEELETLERRLRERHESRQSSERQAPLFGVARGANVITIQLEAIQAHVLHMKMGGEEITPVLNRLAGESLVFDKYYHQTAQGRTSDAEFSTLCSLCPLSSGSVFIRFPETERPCLPRLLRDQGYSATAYHGYFGSFWNRTRAYPSLGLESYVSREALEDGVDIGLGLSDADFYSQIAPLVAKTKEPFLAHVISLTSHHPFTMPEPHLDLDTGKFEGTPFEHYLASVKYADATMGEFLDELERSGLLERSILVIYGDHDMGHLAGAERAWETVLGLDKSKPLHRLDIEKRVVMMIRLPGGKHARAVSGVSGMTDLAPTLLHLLGAEEIPHEMIGRNRLGETPGLVTFRDGSVLTDDRLFLADESGVIVNGACWSTEKGTLEDVEDCREEAQEGLDQLTVSDHFIRHGGDFLPRVAP